MSILSTAPGQELTPLVKPPITLEQLRRYAMASGDGNPIHIDEEAAHRVGLDSIIAHGMLSMAFLGQFVLQQISDLPGAYLAQLKVRFLNMVRLDDTLTCHGFLKMSAALTEKDYEAVIIECWAQNQKGEKVTSGHATVHIPLTLKEEVKA